MSKTQSTADFIRKHAFKKGVTIVLDFEGTSQEAQMSYSASFDPQTKILSIVVSQVSDKELIFEIIKKVHSDGDLIWKTTKEETLSSYKDYSEAGKDNDILAFFAGILTPGDYEALKMACFIRNEMLNQRNIYEYKKDIRVRFGDRGANISNLCSAGYFEKEFMPLYKEVNKTDFFEYYELAVGKKARALFIHSSMGEAEIEEEFTKMVDKAQRYHMVDFRIHGLGENNVNTIKSFFANRIEEPDEKFDIAVRYEKKLPTRSIEYVVTML
jgi:hypothetical protein